MQVLESSVLGVRSAIRRFEHADDPLRFELYPMVHIADRSFYEGVRSRVERCDWVLYEGVCSFRARLLTCSYRIAARRRRLGLVCQSEMLPRSAFGERSTLADVSAPEFSDYWRQVPIWQRAAFYLLGPLVGVGRYLTASRRSLARRLTVDDLRQQDDPLIDEDLEAVATALIESRDQRLLGCVLASHLKHRHENVRIGIVYGAAHMPRVIRLLGELGYRTRDAEWLTVFDI